MALVIACAFAFVTSCSANDASGVRGDLVYVGGPPPGFGLVTASRTGKGHGLRVTGGRVASVSFEEGHGFSIALPPGKYRIAAESGDAICRDQHVAVNQDMYSE